MDNLRNALVAIAENNDPSHTWSIMNNGTVLVVTASTRVGFDGPAGAFDEAQRMLAALTVDDYRVVNRAEIGASCEAFGGEEVPEWRGTLEVCLWREGELEEHHTLIGTDW